MALDGAQIPVTDPGLERKIVVQLRFPASGKTFLADLNGRIDENEMLRKGKAGVQRVDEIERELAGRRAVASETNST